MSLPKLEVPSFELMLPSTGKKIKYRPFLVKEHKALLMMTDSSDDEMTRVVQEIVDICTFNKLKVHDLPNFDIEYMFAKIRSKSLGEKLSLIVTCRNCENSIPTKLNLDELKVIKNENHSTKIMINDMVGVEMKYPSFNVNLYKLIDEGLEKYFEEIENCIKAIYTKDGKYIELSIDDKEEVSDFVASMTSEQFAKIEEFFLTMPKLSHDIAVTCDQCQTINTAKVEGLSNFFV